MTSPLRLAREAVQSCLAPTPDDMGAVDYIFSVMATNYLSDKGDPLWGWLIGPPGSMKTELLRISEGHNSAILLSSLTPNALVSGYDRPDGTDPSLLPLFDGKIVIIKEFTSILQLPEVAVRQIFAHLRSAYDGFHGKGTGTVGIRTHKSRFTLLAAVTQAIDKYNFLHSELGERFIGFRLSRKGARDETERRRVAAHVWAASDTKAQWRNNLKVVYHEIIDKLQSTRPALPAFSDDDRDQLIGLADLLALMRSFPTEGSPPIDPEVATRTVQQVKHLAAGRCVADARSAVNPDDLAFVRRVVHDTIPASVMAMVKDIHDKQTEATLANYVSMEAVSKSILIPRNFLDQITAQYAYSGLLHRNGDNVRLSDGFLKKLDSTQLLTAG